MTDVDEPPARPAAPTVTRTGTRSVTVAWHEPVNTGPPITDYDVRYRSVGWAPHPHAGTLRTATITELTPATGYEVQVRASNAEGTGDWSPSARTRTHDAPRFAAGDAITLTVAELHADAAPVGAPLAASDPDGDTPSFSLTSAGTDHHSFTIDPAGQIRVAPGVTLDYETKSTYTVIAQVTDGEDDAGRLQDTPSVDDTITVTIRVLNRGPGVPRISFRVFGAHIKAGAALDRAIRVEWQPPHDDGKGPISHYRVYWYRLADYAGTVTSTSVTAQAGRQDYTITGLTNDVAYGFSVSSVRVGEESPFPSSGTTPLDALPYTAAPAVDWFSATPTAGSGVHAHRTPGNLRVSAPRSGQLVVAWDAPFNTDLARYYNVAWTPSTSFVGAPNVEKSKDARSHGITGLTGGQVYQVRVATEYQERDGDEGNLQAPAFTSGTALTGPSAVGELEIVAGDGRLDLRWTAPARDGGLPLAHYQVRWGAADGALGEPVDVGLLTTYAVAGLSNGQAYQVEVRAVNSGTDPNPGGGGAARSFAGAPATGTATPDAPPLSGDLTKSTMIDQAVSFAAADFPFTDPGDSLAAVTIVTLPAEGQGGLQAGDPAADVAAGDRIAAADLGTLTFTPASGFIGTASFRFRVEDTRGSESGVSTAWIQVLERAPQTAITAVLGVSLVSDPGTDAAYAVGDTIRARATFNRSVDLDTGSPRQLTLAFVNGATTVQKTAAYASGDGTGSVEFTYTVAAGDAAPDGVAIPANAVNLDNMSTVNTDLTHAAVPADAGHAVDGVAPSVSAPPALASSPAAGDTYRRGETVAVALAFSEPVGVNGAPRLGLLVGGATRQAVYAGGTGTATLTFGYAVAAADADADGVSVPAGAVAPAGGTIGDLAGNAATLTHAALAAQAGHQVSGNTAPVADAGSDLRVAGGAAVRMDGAGSRDADGDVLAHAWTQTGGATVELSHAQGPNPVFTAPATDAELEFSLVVSDGVASSAADTVGVSVDAAPAVITALAITSTPRIDADRNGTPETYRAGDTVEVTVTWDEEVTWDLGAPNAALQVPLDVGGTTRMADLVTGGATRGSGTALAFRHTVVSGDVDADGIAPTPRGGALVLLENGATLKDSLGRVARRTYAAPAADPGHRVDARAPALTGATVYGATLTLTFDERLDARSQPAPGAFAVAVGGSGRAVDGVAVNGAVVTLTLVSPAAAGQAVTVGYQGGGSLLLDAAGNPAPTFSGRRVENRTGQIPSLLSVAITSTPAVDTDGDGTPDTYRRDDRIEVTATWEADVTWDVSAAGAELRVGLAIGSETRPAALVTGGHAGGTARALVFRYVVVAADADSDGIVPTPAGGDMVLLVNGATLQDAEGRAVRRTHAAPAADPNHRVDGSRAATDTAPTAGDLARSVAEDATFTFTRADFDGVFADADGHALKAVRIDTLPDAAHGTLRAGTGAPPPAVTAGDAIAVADLATLHFVPVADWHGQAGFTFAVIDATDRASAAATVTITVDPVADLPTASAIVKSVDEDTTLSFTASDFTGAYHDRDGDALKSVTIVTLPDAAHGALHAGSADPPAAVQAGASIAAADLGTLKFVPVAHWHGEAGFTFTVTDATDRASAAAAAVTITVNTIHDLPTAAAIALSVAEDTTLSFAVTDFTDAFEDHDGDTMESITFVTLPDAAHGTLRAGTADPLPAVSVGGMIATADLGTLKFVPVADWNGTASFTFSVRDSTSRASAAATTVTITVNAVDDLPTASAIAKSVAEDTTLTFAATDFTGAFGDPDGHTLKSVTIVTLPDATHGTLYAGSADPPAAVQAGGSITAADLATLRFVPVAQWHGAASFTYQVTDSSDSESAAAATVTVTVNAVDDAPTAGAIAKSVAEDTTLTFAATDFTGAFSDPEGHTLKSVKIVTLPDATHGTLDRGQRRSAGRRAGGWLDHRRQSEPRCGSCRRRTGTARPASPTRSPTPATRSPWRQPP